MFQLNSCFLARRIHRGSFKSHHANLVLGIVHHGDCGIGHGRLAVLATRIDGKAPVVKAQRVTIVARVMRSDKELEAISVQERFK